MSITDLFRFCALTLCLCACTKPTTAPDPSQTHPHEHGAMAETCGADADAAALRKDTTTVTRDAAGNTVTHAGDAFTPAPEVTVSELLAKPDSWNGKRVSVRGAVTAMCTHRRAWFAVADKAGDEGQLQILTAPSFLVPANSVGTKARAEGTVDVIDLDPAAASHLASEHKLGKAQEGSAPVKRVVLRASGAEFI